MKKIFALAATALFIMTSCSSDEATPTTNNPGTNPTDNVLLKKIIFPRYDGVMVTSNYVYNGNKIVTETDSEGLVRTFTYNGNLISQIVETVDGNPFTDYTFEYDGNGSLVTHTYTHHFPPPPMLPNNPWTTSTITAHYTYNNDGTISYEDFLTSSTQPDTQEHEHGVITMVNGNMVKKVAYRPGNQVLTDTYTFDNKNNPLRNVQGAHVLALTDFGYDQNNETSFTYTVTPESEYNFTETTTYTYNSQNYPVTSTAYDEEGQATGTTQYFYE
jgi:hypothetical protein